LKRTIACAFVKAGLVEERNSEDALVKSVLTKRGASLSEMFVTDERDSELLKRQKLGASGDVRVEFTPAGHQTIITVTPIDPTHPAYKLVIDAIAEAFYQKSTVIPVHELMAELERQKKLKKLNVSKAGSSKRSLQNPCTTTGLAVNADLIQELAEQEEEKTRLAAAKRESDRVQMEKKLVAKAGEKAAGKEVSASQVAGNGAWKKMKGDTLKLAYKYLTNKEVKNIVTSSVGAPKKADIIAAIEQHFEAAVADVQGAAEPVADMEIVVEL
jgi:hypothetical protein